MSKGVKRDDVSGYLDEYLHVADIEDSSPNGLQVQGAARIERIAFAVDASVQTITAAARARAEMLIVHHGLWWGTHEQIVGNMYERISRLVRGDLSLYAAHLPLDCHPEVGNNVELARLLGFDVVGSFARYKGISVGVMARPQKALKREQLSKKMESVLGEPPDVLAFGPDRIGRAAILSGGGAMFAEEARREGCDTLITGETSHSAFHMAKEAGVNLMYGGHYATETVGLKALAQHLKKRYPITTKFIPAPTGY